MLASYFIQLLRSKIDFLLQLKSSEVLKMDFFRNIFDELVTLSILNIINIFSCKKTNVKILLNKKAIY